MKKVEVPDDMLMMTMLVHTVLISSHLNPLIINQHRHNIPHEQAFIERADKNCLLDLGTWPSASTSWPEMETDQLRKRDREGKREKRMDKEREYNQNKGGWGGKKIGHIIRIIIFKYNKKYYYHYHYCNNNNKKKASCRITVVGPTMIYRNLKDKKAQSLQGKVRLESSTDNIK